MLPNRRATSRAASTAVPTVMPTARASATSPARPALLMLLGILAALAPAGAAAQDRDTPSAVVRGVVRDSGGGEPVAANVSITLANGGVRVSRTDDAGGFVVRLDAAGAATLRVRALGYRGLAIPLELRAGQDTTIALRLAPVAIALAPVRTVATAPERQRFEETPDVARSPSRAAR